MGFVYRKLKKELPTLRGRLASLFTLPTGEDDSARACQTYDEFSNHTVQSTNKLHYYDAGKTSQTNPMIH